MHMIVGMHELQSASDMKANDPHILKFFPEGAVSRDTNRSNNSYEDRIHCRRLGTSKILDIIGQREPSQFHINVIYIGRASKPSMLQYMDYIFMASCAAYGMNNARFALDILFRNPRG